MICSFEFRTRAKVQINLAKTTNHTTSPASVYSSGSPSTGTRDTKKNKDDQLWHRSRSSPLHSVLCSSIMPQEDHLTSSDGKPIAFRPRIQDSVSRKKPDHPRLPVSFCINSSFSARCILPIRRSSFRLISGRLTSSTSEGEVEPSRCSSSYFTPSTSTSTSISATTTNPASRLVLGLANLINVPATASRSNPTRDRQRSRPPSSGFHPAGVPPIHWTTRCRSDSCSRSSRTGISNRVRTRASSIGSSPDQHRGLYRRRRCCVARPSYLDHDLNLDLYSDYYANSNFNSALDPDIDLDLDLDLDLDVDMPFRSNHIPPSPAAEQCMNPQLASRTVLRCERPYLDVDIRGDDRVRYRYGNADEDMNMGSGSGSGRTYSYNYNYNPAEVRVKEEFEPVPRSGTGPGSGWVSPFESWQGHGRQPLQPGTRPGLDPGPTSTSASRHMQQVYYPQRDQHKPERGQRAVQMKLEMGSTVDMGGEIGTGLGHDIQPRAGSGLGYYQYPQDHQHSGSRSFDMQPMVVNMPPIQHPGPPRYTSDASLPRLASQGQYQNQNQNQAQMQGQVAGGYYEEYAASTPSTTSSVYQYPGPSSIANANVHAQTGARAGWQASASEREADFGMPDIGVATGTTTGQGNSPSKFGLPRTSSFGLGVAPGIGASGQMGLEDPSGSGMGEASGSMGQGGQPGQPGQIGGGVGASGSAPGAGAGGAGGSGGKAVKKKAAKACLQCQRAHLTCDDCEYEARYCGDAPSRSKADG